MLKRSRQLKARKLETRFVRHCGLDLSKNEKILDSTKDRTLRHYRWNSWERCYFSCWHRRPWIVNWHWKTFSKLKQNKNYNSKPCFCFIYITTSGSRNKTSLPILFKKRSYSGIFRGCTPSHIHVRIKCFICYSCYPKYSRYKNYVHFLSSLLKKG